MAKTDMLCPFTQRLCTECALYRGRHFYLGTCQRYRGYIGKPKANTKSGTRHHSGDLPIVRNWLPPWVGSGSQAETAQKIRLKVIDMESGETRVCHFEESKTWDWSGTKVVRVIGDIQITSWDKLAEILRFKVEKGCQEVAVYEFPPFMLLAGG